MRRIHTVLAAALAALAAAAAAPLAAQDYGAATVRGAPPSRSAERIDVALREFGFRPERLDRAEVRAINDTWSELFGQARRGYVLTPRQATAIVYLALVHERRGRRDDRYSPVRDDRPRAWGPECERMEGDAYRLGLLITAPESGTTGLFVQEPERGRARALARQIQEQAIRCRVLGAADLAGEILTALSSTLPGRSDLEQRVSALKREIAAAAPRARW
jgi:hypothetical protein